MSEGIQNLFDGIEGTTDSEKLSAIVKLLSGCYSELVTIRRYWERFDAAGEKLGLLMSDIRGCA